MYLFHHTRAKDGKAGIFRFLFRQVGIYHFSQLASNRRRQGRREKHHRRTQRQKPAQQMNQKRAGVGIVGVDLVEDHHTVCKTPQTHEVVSHRQNGQNGLVHRSHAVFREECPFLVGEPFSGSDLTARFGIVDARKTQILEGVVEQRRAMQQLQVKLSIRSLVAQRISGFA